VSILLDPPLSVEEEGNSTTKNKNKKRISLLFTSKMEGDHNKTMIDLSQDDIVNEDDVVEPPKKKKKKRGNPFAKQSIIDSPSAPSSPEMIRESAERMISHFEHSPMKLPRSSKNPTTNPILKRTSSFATTMTKNKKHL